MKTTVRNYSSYITSHGIIPVLFILRMYEVTENYEECAKIKASIDEMNHMIGGQLPTRFCKEAVDSVREDYKCIGVEGEKLTETIEAHARLILNKILDLQAK